MSNKSHGGIVDAPRFRLVGESKHCCILPHAIKHRDPIQARGEKPLIGNTSVTIEYTHPLCGEIDDAIRQYFETDRKIQ